MSNNNTPLSPIPFETYIDMLDRRLKPSELELGSFVVLMTAVKDPSKKHEAYDYNVRIVEPCEEMTDHPDWFSVSVQHVNDDLELTGDPCWLILRNSGEIDIEHEPKRQDPSIIGAYLIGYDIDDKNFGPNSAISLLLQYS